MSLEANIPIEDRGTNEEPEHFVNPESQSDPEHDPVFLELQKFEFTGNSLKDAEHFFRLTDRERHLTGQEGLSDGARSFSLKRSLEIVLNVEEDCLRIGKELDIHVGGPDGVPQSVYEILVSVNEESIRIIKTILETWTTPEWDYTAELAALRGDLEEEFEKLNEKYEGMLRDIHDMRRQIEHVVITPENVGWTSRALTDSFSNVEHIRLNQLLVEETRAQLARHVENATSIEEAAGIVSLFPEVKETLTKGIGESMARLLAINDRTKQTLASILIEGL